MMGSQVFILALVSLYVLINMNRVWLYVCMCAWRCQETTQWSQFSATTITMASRDQAARHL